MHALCHSKEALTVTEADCLAPAQPAAIFLIVSVIATKDNHGSSGCGRTVVASDLACLNTNAHLINI